MGRQLADLAAESDQDAPDGPVFVDETGRRSRRYRRIGVLVGLACAVYAALIVSTLLSGNSSAPWLPIDPKDEKPASKVDTPDRPADPLDPAASPGTTPSPGASESGTTAPATGDDGSADPAEPDDGKDKPGETPDPDPTGGGNPDPDPTDDGGDPDPTDDPTKPDPDPDPTDDPTTPDPDPSTETPGGAAGGGGEVPAVQPAADTQSPHGAQAVSNLSPQSAGQQPSEGAQR
ncbi:hypothetical protein M4V62_25910 [Streptomyces durmitorensis]|uniref:Translation initiation factor IF-2 n=1 Tax=Streptomyces durmitorensis TaxID=319947 RepID=A0ABY4PYM2_9ACTN|nr:hypothetical protein [Streptomyces durmitorensis]UQT58240.1 hypothetical protein M4V62_25910 [Streptomyces durmitorensis]